MLMRILDSLIEHTPVLAARRNGDRMRRCNTVDMPRDVRRVLGDINDVLDQLP